MHISSSFRALHYCLPLSILLTGPSTFGSGEAVLTSQTTVSLPVLEIEGQRIANLEPAGTFAAPVSLLNLEPFVDIQSRNMAEAQGDVTIRGGIFENTGFRVGAATLFDPQTGHYFAEIPLAPEFLTAPEILTGAANALYGFNSIVGTVDFGFAPIHQGGSATLGFGDKNLNYQRLESGFVLPTNWDNWTWGVQAEVSRSEGDGTRENGEHTFNRYSGRVQLVGPNSQSEVFAGYQAKFFSWPNLYTPFNFVETETENLKTTLIGLNHRQTYGWERSFEVTTYYRRNVDDYRLISDVINVAPFLHETEVFAIGWQGRHALSDAWFINYAGQATADSIESSSLEENFTHRSYFKGAVIPEYRFFVNDATAWVFQLGLAYDYTNRDGGAWSPIAEVAYERTLAEDREVRLYTSYSEATQVSGYTAIGGLPSGLFASNPDLGRERSRNLEVGFDYRTGPRRLAGAVFHRWDEDLVDWTFNSAATNARTASNVDVRTLGLEMLASQRWSQFEALVSYTFLYKSEDYGDAPVDSSFYALNFPRHRVTLSAIWNVTDFLDVRVDNEFRKHEDNLLRAGKDEALYTNLGATVRIPQVDGLEFNARIDNLWKVNFQEVPGTPGRGRQVAADLTYRW